jgi:ssDNA-specific exonuclease RecJ
MSLGIPNFDHAIRKSNRTIRKEKFNLIFKNLHFSTMSSGNINFNSTIKKKRLTLPSGSFRLNLAIMMS